MNCLLALTASLLWLLQSFITVSAGNVNSGAPPIAPPAKDLTEAPTEDDMDGVERSPSSRRLQMPPIRTPFQPWAVDLHNRDGVISGMVHVDSCSLWSWDPYGGPYFTVEFFNETAWSSVPGVRHTGGDYMGCMGDMCDAANVTWDQATYNLAAEAYKVINVGSNPTPWQQTGERAVLQVMGPLRLNFSEIQGIGHMVQGNTTPPGLDLIFATGEMASGMPDNYIDLPPGPQAIIFWMLAPNIPAWSMRFHDINMDAIQPQALGAGMMAHQPQCSSSIWIPPQTIPSDATHMVVRRGFNGYHIHLLQFVSGRYRVPDPPKNVTFKDTDSRENRITGYLEISPPENNFAVWQFVLFWGTEGRANRTMENGWMAKYYRLQSWGGTSMIHQNDWEARIGDSVVNGQGYGLVATFDGWLWVEEADTYRFEIADKDGNRTRVMRLLVDSLQVGFVEYTTLLRCGHYLGHGWHRVTIEYEEMSDFDGVRLQALYAGADTFFVLSDLDFKVWLSEEPWKLWMVDGRWNNNMHFIHEEIPPGATHLHIFSRVEDWTSGIHTTFMSTEAYILPIVDTGARAPEPDRVAFHDTDPGVGVAAGEVMIYGDMHNVEQFNLYWGDAYGHKLSMDPVFTVHPSSSGRRLCGQKGPDNSMKWDHVYSDYYSGASIHYYESTLDIVNGREATECEWPWQVHLINDLFPSAFCGGTLISPRWVVTAAHCVVGAYTDKYWVTVRVGKHDNKEGPEDNIAVKNIIAHPKWDGSIFNADDIALIELVRDAVSSDCVGYACLPDAPPVPGTECYVTGWGSRTHTNGQQSPDLKEAPVTIVPRGECLARHMAIGATDLVDGIVCVAGFEDVGVTSPCFGDSGGPLVCQAGDTSTWELFGATSGGWQCAGWNFPALYTDLWHYKEWIMENVDESVEVYQGSGVTKVMLPPMPMPADAYYLMAFSQGAGMEGTQAAMTHVMDLAPPQAVPTGIMFNDTAAERNEAAGLLTVHCAASEQGIDVYQVYYAKPGGNNIDMLAELPTCAQRQLWSGASTTETSMWLDRTRMPFTTGRSLVETPIHLRAYAVSHAHGMGMNFTAVQVVDYVSSSAPKAVHFDDKDPSLGMVGGPVDWDVSSSGNYTLEWASSPSCYSALTGEEMWTLNTVTRPSMPSVSCEGPTCALISIYNNTGVDGPEIVISHLNYGDNEEATLRFEGPATLHLTYFFTEPNDFFIIADDLRRPYQRALLRNRTGLVLRIPESGWVARWNSDDRISGFSWVFALRPVLHASEPPAMVEHGTHFPSHASYMLLKDSSGECAMTMVHDSAPTMEVTEMATFMDEDALQGRIMGTVHITRTVPMPSEPTSFSVFFAYMGGSGMPMAMEKPIASEMAFGSDSMVQVHVPRTYLPRRHMVTHLLVYAANATGQAMQSYSLPLTDLVAPTVAPMAAYFGDSDARVGVVGGNMSVTRHPSDTMSTHWSIYWSIGGMEGGFVTRALQMGMPRCEGSACKDIEIRPGRRPESWIISRGMDGYEAGEYANITIPGDGGEISITADLRPLSAGNYDVLSVMGERLSGRQDRRQWYNRGEELLWYSSLGRGGSSSGGWSVEVNPVYYGLPGGAGRPHPVLVPAVSIPPGADGFIVKAALGTTDSPLGLFVPFQDFAPPQVVATDVSFHDTDLAVGYVAGPVMITRAGNDLVAGVQAYCLWANDRTGYYHNRSVVDCHMITASTPATISIDLPRVDINYASRIFVFASGMGGSAVEGVEVDVVDEIGLWASPMDIEHHLPHGSMSTEVNVTVYNDGTEMATVFPFITLETDCDEIPSKMELMSIAGVRDDYYEYYYGLDNMTTRRLQEAQPSQEPPPGVGNVLFKLQDAFDADSAQDTVAMLAEKYMFKVRTLKGMGWTVATPDNQEAVKDLCEALKAEPEVKHCEMDQPVSAPQHGQISARRLMHHMEKVMPNDPHFTRSTHLYSSGDDDDDHGHDINARAAWKLGTGTGETVVAVIDSAVDYKHPDLFPNIWSNTGEVPGNGIDDDGNGYIDDVWGWDFADNDSDPSPDAGWEEKQMHGTHVSGIIGAVGNNSLGVSGVNWHAKIMPLKIMREDDGSIWLSAAFEAMEYALENGAKIIVAAWSTYSWSGHYIWEDIMMEFVIEGALLITSAGNGECDWYSGVCYGRHVGLTTYNQPCALQDKWPQIVCVGATSPHGLKAYFSNHGDEVSLGAPGVDIWSTIPGDDYGVHSGTSSAAAVVAGAASLLWDTFPYLKFWEIKASLLEGADKVNHLDPYFKEGRKLNVHKAMMIAGSAFWARENVHVLEVPPMSSKSFMVTLGSPLLCTSIMHGSIQFYTTPLLKNYWGQINLMPTVVEHSMAPTSKPASVMFMDMDTTQGIVGGSLYITAPFQVHEVRDYDHYSLWWADAQGPISKIMDIAAPGTMMDEPPAMDDFKSMPDSWFLPDAGVGYMYHSGLLTFHGPFSMAHRTFSQMVQAPFQLGFQVHPSNGTMAAVMIQIGEGPMAVKAMIGSDNSFMVVLPDGSAHRSGCSYTEERYQPPKWIWNVLEEQTLPWSILHIMDDAILLGGDDDDCGLRVPWTFSGLYKLMVGSDCTGHCANMGGSTWETMAFRPMTDTAVVTLQGLVIPSGADHLEVRTQSFFGMADQGNRIPFEDNFTLGPPVPPSDVMAGSPTISTLTVTWTANSLNSCVFSSWKVEAMLMPGAGGWTEVTGCQIMDAMVTTCVASGLMSNTLYMFRVLPVCDTTGDADPSDPSAAVRTLAVASDPPGGVAATSVVLGTSTVSWQAAILNDCIFQAYDVNVRASSSTMWSDNVQGCTSLSSFTQPFCTAQGLDDTETYEFRVAVMCKDGAGNSPWSTPSLPTVVLTIDVAPPDEFTQTTFIFNIDFTQIANDDALAAEVIDAVGDVFEALLGFRPESVSLQQGAAIPGQLRPLSVVVVLPGTNNLDETALGNSVSSAITNRTAVQGDVVSSSASSQKGSFPPVLDAGSPGQVQLRRLQGSQYNVLVEWDLLPVNDCLFSSFSVIADPLHIPGPAFTPEGCAGLTQISTTSCTARNLESTTMQTMYNFTVTVVCSNSIASSNPSSISTVTLPIAPSSTTSTSSSQSSMTSDSSTTASSTSMSTRSSRSTQTTSTSTSTSTSETSETSESSTSSTTTTGSEEFINTTTTTSVGPGGSVDDSSSVRQFCVGGRSWLVTGLIVSFFASM